MLPRPSADDAGALLASAWQHYARGDLGEAIAAARHAHDLDPGWLEPSVALGKFLTDAGEFADAGTMLDSVLAAAPTHAAASWYRGDLLRHLGKLADAEAALRNALQLDPGLDEARVALAWVLHDQARFDEALTHSSTAVRANALPHRLIQLGWLLLQTGATAQAVSILERTVALTPTDGSVCAKLAIALAADGQDAAAEAMLRRGLATAPDDADLLRQLGWNQHRRGEVEGTRRIATALVERHPEMAGAWHLLAVAHETGGNLNEADACYARAQALAPGLTDIVMGRAALLRRRDAIGDAAWLLEVLLVEKPAHPAATLALAQLRLDQDRAAEARALIHRLWTAPNPNHRWDESCRLLAAALHRLGRPAAALRFARRAVRIAPDSDTALELAAWLSFEAGDIAGATDLSDRRIAARPTDPHALVQGVYIAIGAGAVGLAEARAELAVARNPESAATWRSLAWVRRSQQRWEEAESCLHAGLALGPERAELLGSLAWTLIGADRLAEAEIAALAAFDAAPAAAGHCADLAEIQRIAGRPADALATLDAAPPEAAGAAAIRRVRARCLAALADLSSPADRFALWNGAVTLLTGLLQEHHLDPETVRDALRLAAVTGGMADALPALLPRALARASVRDGIEHAVAHAGAEEVRDWIALGRQLFPDDDWIGAAGLYVDALTGTPPADQPTRVRRWSRRLAATIGTALPPRPIRHDRKPRVAYLASHLHGPLLLPVLAAHDPDAVEVRLYTPETAAATYALGGAVAVQPLPRADLAASLQAAEVDIVVDTCGLHPFHGQFEILAALRRRVAPVQCGWLGCWGTGGGLYDALILDDEALPPAHGRLIEEQIIRIPGGQWAWAPPLQCPDAGPPPLLRHGHPTFGVTARGFRLSRATLETWAALLAAVPNARLEVLGTQSRDWRLRATLAEICRERAVDPERIGYRYRLPYAAHLKFFRNIDVCLDPFPGNGGLSSLDALWMGVPVVTMSDETGVRQGAALLQTIGQGAWVADSAEAYVAIAAALVRDAARLTDQRAALRQQMRAAPLADPARVARHLEASWQPLLAEAATIVAAPDAKSIARALARRELRAWLARGERLTLPQSPDPEISVVIVTYNQAGLTRQALMALADQQGVAFETILVDNASSDETTALLERVEGAVIARNGENGGFLRGANQGAALAYGRFILFLNNDAILQDNALAAAAQRLREDAEIGIVGGRIILADGRLQEAGCVAFADGSTVGYGRGRAPGDPEFRFARDVDFCSGVFLMVRRALWRRLGGFDSAFAPAYYEDTDFCFRARRAGCRVAYEPGATVTHLEWGSAAPGEATEAMRRNQTLFLARHRDALSTAATATTCSSELLAERWAHHAGPRILMIENGVPHQAGGAGLPRARLILQALAGRPVTFYPLWQTEDDWQAVYGMLPATTEVMLDGGIAGLERFLERRRGIYQVLLVSRPPNLAAVSRLRARRPDLFQDLRVVYDSEALFAAREIREAAVRGRPLTRAAIRQRFRAEMALARSADRVLAVSARERAQFRAAGNADVRLVSHGMPTRRDAPGPQGRKGLLFIGSLVPGTPNEDGLLWFAETVLPRLRDRMTAPPPLSIVGECRSSRIAALACPEIRLLGPIENLTPIYDEARVFIAPARFAAGVPAKVIEAACNGLPVVASMLLARQLGWSDAEILAARDAAGFADAIIRLLTDDTLWRGVRCAMQARTAEAYDPDDFAAAVGAALTFSESGAPARL